MDFNINYCRNLKVRIVSLAIGLGTKRNFPWVPCDGAHAFDLGRKVRSDHRYWYIGPRVSRAKGRGVQYVHCVMNKCIMVKLAGGNKKHRKYVKKHVNFTKSGGKFAKVRGK